MVLSTRGSDSWRLSDRASYTRLRPIVMTTSVTSGGLLHRAEGAVRRRARCRHQGVLVP